MTVQTHRQTNADIGEVVRLFMLHRRVNRDALAVILGISTKTLNRRINGQLDWTAAEVAEVASHFEVPVSVFYAGADSLMAGISTSRFFRPDLIAA